MAVNNEEAVTAPISEGELKKVYYEHFIDDLTDEELMYKKTVEDLFYIYKSFGFIYSIIKKANLLLSKESFDMFLKSLVSFIDELFLNNPSLFDAQGNDVKANYANKEIGGGVTKKRKGELDQTYIINNSDNQSFMIILSKTYIEELLKDISNIDPNFSERNAQDYLFITKNVLKMKNTLEVEHVKNRIDKLKNILNVGKNIFLADELVDDSNESDGNKKIKVHDHIDEMIEKLKTIGPSIVAIVYKQNLWYKQIVNKSEYDSLNSILNIDVDADSKVVESTYADVILLLGEKMTQNKDLLIAKEKLERLKTNYDAEVQRKLQQEMELSKKLEDKRKAVQFIIDRYNEYTWFDKNSPKKHSFYIIGINPRTTTEEQLKSFGKRLKHILHPDKEPDREWKKKAESAFKEASLAILGCQQEFKTKVLKNLEPGPPAPYLALIGMEAGAAASGTSGASGAGGSGVTATSAASGGGEQGSARLPQYYPTQAYYPKFELKCVDQKIGTILIDIKCPVQLGVVKKVILYVHRPIYGAEPLNLIPEDSFLSHKMEQNVNVKNLNQPIEARVDFVQPLEIAASTKYYIGVQLIAERGNTMINWNSINITLHKFSNKNIIKKLLSSFKNASFINQAQLNVALSNENKDEMTKYLNECIAAAKIWAQTV
ncbi:conserved Plasmodium protein, unknown function [Plasmodium vivax]|uniref:DnaJ protein n=4 Tax=Plasmodium vivax TaxID=5855 RepID=A5K6P0_PLAVS|nr:hypothetical protein, conserved [Plasmodium vivax]KMZ81242.1 hypothetical protein PVIIG_04828 [Plasmodium vivax India VII]KNA00376.1 hypothetical protein PVNG_01010 [Plasmodium vivax North Korean]EDL44981.1 hypothetical protein, conserved [Plasmodium vivax]CAG9480538.1 unnamed protein product [Plasmodium vivax]CAI7719617.1 conserved protein, unknown function [Plasmodium vivax]|eukprot:XP_001614708.1 hypothetical protein [Plasmodium vivax Sal-1]